MKYTEYKEEMFEAAEKLVKHAQLINEQVKICEVGRREGDLGKVYGAKKLIKLNMKGAQTSLNILKDVIEED